MDSRARYAPPVETKDRSAGMTRGFRRAEPDDEAAAQAAYRRIIEHLAHTVDFPRWHAENHPTPDEVHEWVAAGELYVATSREADHPEQIAGVVVLNHEAHEAYADVEWAVEATPEEVMVIHALGVAPEFLRQGVARFLVDSSIRVAREQGCRAIRLDTFVDNTPARELYARYGFTDLGAHEFHYEGTDLTRFHLFEYVL